MSWELHNVAIIGGGMMGRSIATKVAQEGLNVCLKEVSSEAVEASRAELEENLDLLESLDLLEEIGDDVEFLALLETMEDGSVEVSAW